MEEGDAASITRALSSPLHAPERERLVRRLVELELRAGRLDRLPGLLLQLPLEKEENQAMLVEVRARLDPDEATRALGLAALMEARPGTEEEEPLPPPPPDQGVGDMREQGMAVAEEDPSEATRLLLRASRLSSIGPDGNGEQRAELLGKAAELCPASETGLAWSLVDALDRADLLLEHRALLEQVAQAERDPLRRRDLLSRLVRASLRRGGTEQGFEEALADQWYAPATDQSWPAEWLALDPAIPRHRARLMLGLVPGSHGDGRAKLLGELLNLRAHLPGGETLAARLLRELCEVRPDHPAARAFLASAAGASAEVPMEMLQRAVELHPDDEDLESHYQKALERAGAWSELHLRLRRTLGRTLGPRRRIPLLLQMDELLSVQMGRPAEGVVQLERALQLSPGDPDMLRRLEQRYAQLERWPALVRLLRQRAATEAAGPGRQELLQHAARLQWDQLNDPEGALPLAREAMASAPAGDDPLHAAGGAGEGPTAASLVEALLDRLGRWKERLDLLRGQLETQSDDAKASRLSLEIGRLLLEQAGDADAATPYLARALRLAPDPAGPLALLRQLHGAQDQQDRLEALLRGLAREEALPPEQRSMFLCEVARIQEEHMLQPGRAEVTFREALDLDPGALPALHALRRRALEDDRWADAAELCQRELELSPTPADRVPLLLLLGQLHHEHLGHPDTALEALTEALNEAPENRQATRLLSELHFQQGQWEEAARHTGRLISRGGGDQEDLHELYYRLAFARENMGRTTEVFSNYIKALTLAPSYLPAMERLVPLCYARRQWETARRISRTILDLHSNLKSEADQARLWLLVALCELHLAQRDIAAHRLREMALPPGEVPSSSSEAWYEVADLWAARELDPRLLPKISSAARQRISEAATRCLEFSPGNPDAHQLLAAMAVVDRAWPEALEEIEKAAEHEDLPPLQRARLWNFSGEVAMRQKLAPLLAQDCFKRSLNLLPDQPEILRKVEILSHSTVEDLTIGIPPHWESQGIPSRLDWLTEPPECEKAPEDRVTLPFQKKDEDLN